MYKLHIRDDAGETTVVPVTRDRITVGRQEGNTIRLTEKNVSRVHARLVIEDTKIVVEDVSRYGIRVNGLRIKERKEVEPSDVIQIGDYQLQVEVEARVADTQPEQPKVKAKVKGKKKSGGKKKRDEVPTRVEAPAAAKSADSTAMINLGDIEKAARSMASSGKSRVVADTPTLVAISTSLAGKEFRLSGAEVVIGRTDDNDVVVDHRSISRNHARVNNKDGRVTIHDLESANGMKINDEYYKQSVLRRGDIVELGHVRLRYVEAGETFVYNPDDYEELTADGEASSSGSGKIIAAVIVLLLLAGGAAAVVVLGGKEPSTPLKGDTQGVTAAKDTSASTGKIKDTAKKKPPVVAKPKKPQPDTTVQAKPQVRDAASKKPPVDPKAQEMTALRNAATAQLKAKQWAEALKSCQALLKLESEDTFAEGCVSRATKKLAALGATKRLDDLLAKNLQLAKDDRWTEAWASLSTVGEIPKTYTKRTTLTGLIKHVKGQYLDQVVDQASKKLKKGSYKEAVTLANKVLRLNKKHRRAKRVLSDARRKAKAAAKRKPKDPKKSKDPKRPKQPKVPKRPKPDVVAKTKLPANARSMSCSQVKRKLSDPVWKAFYNKGCKYYYFGRTMFGKWAGADGDKKAGYKKRGVRALRKFLGSGHGSSNDKSNARGLNTRMGG